MSRLPVFCGISRLPLFCGTSWHTDDAKNISTFADGGPAIVLALPTKLEDVPAYYDPGLLTPMSPSQNDRYDKQFLTYVENMNIPAGMHSAMRLPNPQYLPEGWSAMVHPEGTPFYIKYYTGFRVVTDVAIHDSALASKVHGWIEALQTHMKATAFSLPEDCELYVTVQSDRDNCEYYFVDYNNRSVLWLHDSDTSALGLPGVSRSSVTHLKHLLEEQYWIHVQHFPHRPVPATCRNELVDILRHGKGDQLTSDSSTFPYDADLCTKFIDLLTVGAEQDTVYLTSVIARLWRSVAYARYVTYYGEDYARLSRSDRRLEPQGDRPGLVFNIFNCLMFAGPENIKRELDLIFVDRIVFGSSWQKFVHNLSSGFKHTSAIASIVLLTNGIFLASPRQIVTPSAAVISEAMAFCGLVAGVSLTHSYSNTDELDTVLVGHRLSDMFHPTRGFAPIAVALSVPRTLVYWSMICTGAHMVLMAAKLPWIVEKVVAVVVLVVLAASLLGTAWTVSGTIRSTRRQEYSAAPPVSRSASGSCARASEDC